MGSCCSSCSSSSDEGEDAKLSGENWTDLSQKSRWCTDIVFLVLIIVVWVVMSLVGLAVIGAIKTDRLRVGNPYRLINPIDYEGNICGYDSVVKNLHKGYYLPDATAVCVSSCPSESNYDLFICRYPIQESVSNGSVGTVGAYEYVARKECMYEIKTKAYINRCIPDTNVDIAASLASSYANSTVAMTTYHVASGNGANWFTNFLGDMYVLRSYVFGFGLGVSAGFAFIYLYVLRIPGLLFGIIWGAVISIFLVFGGGSYLLWQLANSWNNDGAHSHQQIVVMQVIAYVGWAITALYFCLMVVLRKRIQLAIAVVKQAARALASIPTILLLPIVQAIGLAAFLVPWFIIVVYLASSGQMQVNSGSYTTTNGQTVSYTYRTFEYDTNTKYAFLYLLFCWFYTSEFIIAFGQLVIALSFSSWYFSKNKTMIGIGTVGWVSDLF